jgi:hypothetical protein
MKNFFKEKTSRKLFNKLDKNSRKIDSTLKNTQYANKFFNLVISRCFSIEGLKSKKDRFLPYQIDRVTNKIIKASPIGIEEKEKTNFANSRCLITLSSGQPVYYGAYLASTLSFIDKNFKSCCFILEDTLERHILKITHPHLNKEELLTKSKEMGDEWLETNAPILSKVHIPWTVKRWSYWLEHPKFDFTLEYLKNKHLLWPNYRGPFDNNITEYIDRLKKRGELLIDEGIARQQCLESLQEECAVMCLWIEEKSQYEVCVNDRILARQLTYENFIQGVHIDLLKPVSLKFKKVKIENELLVHSTTEEVNHVNSGNAIK